mmetsp:Transcript_14540/g.41852  ORF Transcript_14540/g.41852 Transcript_14540/m.41852 type:complete len:213 (-) Transcript_14540:698-1336(-)
MTVPPTRPPTVFGGEHRPRKRPEMTARTVAPKTDNSSHGRPWLPTTPSPSVPRSSAVSIGRRRPPVSLPRRTFPSVQPRCVYPRPTLRGCRISTATSVRTASKSSLRRRWISTARPNGDASPFIRWEFAVASAPMTTSRTSLERSGRRPPPSASPSVSAASTRASSDGIASIPRFARASPTRPRSSSVLWARSRSMFPPLVGIGQNRPRHLV